MRKRIVLGWFVYASGTFIILTVLGIVACVLLEQFGIDRTNIMLLAAVVARMFLVSSVLGIPTTLSIAYLARRRFV